MDVSATRKAWSRQYIENRHIDHILGVATPQLVPAGRAGRPRHRREQRIVSRKQKTTPPFGIMLILIFVTVGNRLATRM